MEKHDHRHKEELLQQMRRQAEIRPEQNDSEPAASSDTGTFKIRLALAGVLLLTIILLVKKAMLCRDLHGSGAALCHRCRLRHLSGDLGGNCS